MLMTTIMPVDSAVSAMASITAPIIQPSTIHGTMIPGIGVMIPTGMVAGDTMVGTIPIGVLTMAGMIRIGMAAIMAAIMAVITVATMVVTMVVVGIIVRMVMWPIEAVIQAEVA